MNTRQKENVYNAQWTILQFCLVSKNKKLENTGELFFYSGISHPKGNYRFAGFVSLQIAFESSFYVCIQLQWTLVNAVLDLQLVLSIVLAVLMVMDDRMRTDDVQVDFTGEKLQCSLRFSRPGLCSNLDHQACSQN